MALIKSISGIRGTIGGIQEHNLTPFDIVKFTTAYAKFISSNSQNNKIVIGRDARISGKMVSDIVSSTLLACGFYVVDLGLSTTPTVELGVVWEKAAGGIIITASHNPKQWNALKLLNSKGEFLSEKDGNTVLKLAENKEFEYSEIDKIGEYFLSENYYEKHIEEILKLKLVDVEAIKARKFKIVVDAVNSSGGVIVPKLLEKLGVQEIIEINCTPNGRFPHNPEPLPEHLTELASEVKRTNSHLGIAVDPDVDRLAFVCENGEMFGEEYTLVAVADYVLQNNKGNTVSNLSSTQALKEITLKLGCNYNASAVGEVNVVEMMKKTKAVIGGEGNGGIIYPELHYGRDALVGIALFLSHLTKSGKTAKGMRMTYPDYYISKNKIELDKDINLTLLLKKIEEKYINQPINKTDGLKIEFDEEWVHLRQSNTEPIIRIYAESKSAVTAQTLTDKIKDDIKNIIMNA